MPELIKLFIRHAVIGFGVAAVFVGLILWLDVMNIGYLVTHTDAGYFALFMFWVLNGLVFGSVQIAYVVGTSHAGNVGQG